MYINLERNQTKGEKDFIMFGSYLCGWVKKKGGWGGKGKRGGKFFRRMGDFFFTIFLQKGLHSPVYMM